MPVAGEAGGKDAEETSDLLAMISQFRYTFSPCSPPATASPVSPEVLCWLGGLVPGLLAAGNMDSSVSALAVTNCTTGTAGGGVFIAVFIFLRVAGAFRAVRTWLQAANRSAHMELRHARGLYCPVCCSREKLEGGRRRSIS
mmetsp:Transcript_102383/g.234813  ORF Transcript_102383/g.234813 Transcript_102383/m.234813 type:complete len:142 (-) Transcript_102383:679-1104(-)